MTQTTTKPEAGAAQKQDQVIASAAAAFAHTAMFSSRRGILPSDGHTVIFYDNNPNDQRDANLERLQEVLAGQGIALLADAMHPPIIENEYITFAGDDGVGYTRTLIFDTSDQQAVIDAYSAVHKAAAVARQSDPRQIN